jgi:hypothetical protein
MHIEKKIHKSWIQYVGPKPFSLQICCPRKSHYGVVVEWLKTWLFDVKTLLEIWHFATVLCNWFTVTCDTCNWKFAQLRTTSCMKFAVTCDSYIIQVHTVGLYGFIHPYFILAVGHATACNYKGCVHTALHFNYLTQLYANTCIFIL